jgi:glycosyltransferase involved in cell wall biosynthesis
MSRRRRVTIVGPVFPYRAGIAYCTTRLAEELSDGDDVTIASFKRQFPQRFYPGSSDVDPSLESKRPAGARFKLDIVNPFTWLREGLTLRRSKPDVVLFVWWIWVWALPYLVIAALLSRQTRVVLQCHNISDKEPAAWKSWLTRRVLRRADALIVHAHSEAREARRRTANRVAVIETFLPVHELGTAIVSREEARKQLSLEGNVALFFGHVRPFKGLDLALRALPLAKTSVLLAVAGEVWWDHEREYRELVSTLGLADRVRLDFRFIPDSEIALWFAACDVVLTPYRTEAQSGVAMTAFHFGRPVIATRVGGVPEIVHDGQNGLLIDPESPESIAAALDRFFGEADRAAMEAAARESAAKYSWGEYGSVVRATIDRAIGAGSSALEKRS